MANSWRRTTRPARSFDQLAASFDRFAELVGGPLNAYLESVFPSQGERAVDLGCGTGQHAAMLATRYRQVLAVDISAPMLQLARDRRSQANVTYQERDLRSVRAETDGTFDLVLSTHALHHVVDLRQTLLGIRGLCAPGGRVVLVDNVAPRPAVPRRWFITEAIRTLALDLLRRRRPLSEVWELYRLNTDPAWLEHVTTDRFLSPDQFAQRYGAVFPGAQFTDLYRTRAMCWHTPDH
jgi:SAM-dependent methyltransferase